MRLYAAAADACLSMSRMLGMLLLSLSAAIAATALCAISSSGGIFLALSLAFHAKRRPKASYGHVSVAPSCSPLVALRQRQATLLSPSKCSAARPAAKFRLLALPVTLATTNTPAGLATGNLIERYADADASG